MKVDDFKAAYDATNFLIDKGHQTIGMISGNLEDPIAGLPRLLGYKNALKDAYLPDNENLIRFGHDFSFEDGKEKFRELVDTNPDMTAVFAASDEMASGAVTAAHQMNIKIPNQISIMGYDNTMIAEIAYPSLTTLSQPLRKMGSEAVKLLLKIINGEDFDKKIILTHSIKERKSVKKIN